MRLTSSDVNIGVCRPNFADSLLSQSFRGGVNVHRVIICKSLFSRRGVIICRNLMSETARDHSKDEIRCTVFSKSRPIRSFGKVHGSRDAACNREPLNSSIDGLVEDIRRSEDCTL